jgi:hypothetical protein
MAMQKQYYRRKKVCKFCVERIDPSITRRSCAVRARTREDHAPADFGVHAASEALSDAIKKANTRCCPCDRVEGFALVIMSFLLSRNTGKGVIDRLYKRRNYGNYF